PWQRRPRRWPRARRPRQPAHRTLRAGGRSPACAQRSGATPTDHRCRARRAGGRADLPGLPFRAAVSAAGAPAAGSPVPLHPQAVGLQQAPAGAGAPDGMPISFCLAPANEPEREVAAAMLERARGAGLLTGEEIIIGDKGFAGQEFEQIVASLDAQLMRPDRKGEPPRFGALGAIRQWIESIYNTTKSQLSLEDHGGHIPEGVWARVCQRVLALAAGVWHNWQLYQAGQLDAPGRHFTPYDH